MSLHDILREMAAHIRFADEAARRRLFDAIHEHEHQATAAEPPAAVTTPAAPGSTEPAVTDTPYASTAAAPVPPPVTFNAPAGGM